MNAPLDHNSAAPRSGAMFLLGTMRHASLNLKAIAAEDRLHWYRSSTNNQISIEAACEDLDALGVLRYLPEQVQRHEKHYFGRLQRRD
jgi:hypothetical protein